jgi:hypothetical protein
VPLFTPAGLSEFDYSPGSIRTEMSDYMFASLMMAPNLLAALRTSQFGGGGTGVGNSVMQLLHYWQENRLNPRTVTDTSGGFNTVATTFTVSLADGALLDINYVIADRSQNLLTAEQIQITGLAVGATSVTVTIVRGFNATTAATHAASAVYEIIATPVQEGSDLGRDQSRAPGIKANTIQSWRRDVIVTGSMVELARHGLVPGIPNQPAFQLHERFWEMLQDYERSVIKGIGTPAATQTATSQTMWGVLAWLGYSNPVPNATAVLSNAAGAAISDLLMNGIGINIYLQGGQIPDVILAHPYVVDRISRIFRDQLRLSQTEVVRGFNVDTIRLSLGTKPVKLLMSGYMPDPTINEGIMAFLDLDKLALVPFFNRFLFLISAPTMKDADLVSLMSQSTLEFRHTGTDFGYTSQILRNFTI